MSPWWLVLIVPCAFSLGYLFGVRFVIGTREDLHIAASQLVPLARAAVTFLEADTSIPSVERASQFADAVERWYQSLHPATREVYRETEKEVTR